MEPNQLLAIPEQLRRSLVNKKAIFFDLDGTLIDSEPLHAQGVAAVLAGLGIHFSAEMIEEKYYGRADTEIFLELKGTATLTPEEFLQRKNHWLGERISQLTEKELAELQATGIEQFIKFLKKNNFLLALVSAAEEEIVETLLQKMELLSFFDAIVPRSATFFSKPNPSPYFRALRALNLHSGQVLVFEDSDVGTAAAKGTGAEVVRVNIKKQDNSGFNFAWAQNL